MKGKSKTDVLLLHYAISTAEATVMWKGNMVVNYASERT
jgi:hypothetical protein